jgi:hypothetical protein
MPRTKPEMIRPPDMTSSMATSSATRSGLRRMAMPLPRMATLARFVRPIRAAAMMLGLGMRP